MSTTTATTTTTLTVNFYDADCKTFKDVKDYDVNDEFLVIVHNFNNRPMQNSYERIHFKLKDISSFVEIITE